MDSRVIVKNIANKIISLGAKTVDKSMIVGMYDPEIPAVLKEKKKKQLTRSQSLHKLTK